MNKSCRLTKFCISAFPCLCITLFCGLGFQLGYFSTNKDGNELFHVQMPAVSNYQIIAIIEN